MAVRNIRATIDDAVPTCTAIPQLDRTTGDRRVPRAAEAPLHLPVGLHTPSAGRQRIHEFCLSAR